MNENYSRKTPEETLKQLNTTVHGLSDFEANQRFKKYGLNELKEGKKDTKLKIFLRQFKSALIGILVAAAIISATIGYYKKDPEHLVDTGVIVIIILLNAVLGFVQEYRAEKAMEALKKMAAPKTTVVRNDFRGRISSVNLVPGDIIVIGTGDRIPADARLIKSASLRVDESALTGESTPVSKKINKLLEKITHVAELSNLLFMNTIITSGRATAVVTATGMQTQIGTIAKLIQKAPEKKTPLQVKLGEIGRFLGIVTILICAAVFGVEILRGGALIPVLMIAISLAVAAVPEGLPAVVTITLGVGLQKMAFNKAIIKRLPAVETLGCTDVICTDKTGTLTKNEMTVREAYISSKQVNITGTGYAPDGELFVEGAKPSEKDRMHLDLLLKAGSLCNNAVIQKKKDKWEIHGDPTEGALLTLALKGGLNLATLKKNYPRTKEFEFNSARKRMTTVHLAPKKKLIAFSKGAPEILLEHCSMYLDGTRKKKLTAGGKRAILKKTEGMAGRALRILAVAYRDVLPKEELTRRKMENKLVFLGLVGMIDPPRPEIRESIKTCNLSGIRTIMITGDHHTTALAIGKEIGLYSKGCLAITGEELEKMSDKKLGKVIAKASIFSRASPEHKVRILKALKARKHIVAMTGDGVNDAPALKSSDIGIAMGISGTDVAKSAADMVLEDDNFSTIVKAIEEGRAIYDNIRKFLNYLLTSNAGEVLIIFVAALIGMPLPLLAVQLLWINLLTDGLPAVALAIDPADEGIMRRKPRNPDEKTISKNMLHSIVLISILMCIATLGLFKWSLSIGMTISQARTVALATIIVLELVRVQAVRAEYNIKLNSNKYLWLAIASSMLLMIAIIYMPTLQSLFHTAALPFSIWPWIIGVSGIVYIAIIVKSKIGRITR